MTIEQVILIFEPNVYVNINTRVPHGDVHYMKVPKQYHNIQDKMSLA